MLFPDGEVMAALASHIGWFDSYSLSNPLSNSLPSVLSPNGLWELSAVIKGQEIYQGYGERLAHKFLANSEVHVVCGSICEC